MTFVQIGNRIHLIVNASWGPRPADYGLSFAEARKPLFFCVDSDKVGHWRRPQENWVFLTDSASKLMYLLFAARGIRMECFHAYGWLAEALSRIEHALSVVREGADSEPDIAKRIMQAQENARILESVRV